MKDLMFSAEDLILIFESLIRLTEKAEILYMDEGQLMACIQHMLTRNPTLG